MLQIFLKLVNYKSIYPLLASQIKSMKPEVSLSEAIAQSRKIK
ncbi:MULTISPECIES: hypothetical protein [unclassified Nodularia (in: cyanobacteria)]|nr:hypothetical protein [Nodularia sp. LEGE 04288]